jgi:hypothetical protein
MRGAKFPHSVLHRLSLYESVTCEVRLPVPSKKDWRSTKKPADSRQKNGGTLDSELQRHAAASAFSNISQRLGRIPGDSRRIQVAINSLPCGHLISKVARRRRFSKTHSTNSNPVGDANIHFSCSPLAAPASVSPRFLQLRGICVRRQEPKTGVVLPVDPYEFEIARCCATSRGGGAGWSALVMSGTEPYVSLSREQMSNQGDPRNVG